MASVKEVNVLEDFGLTLDHFYTIVKTQIGNLDINQYVQVQATAVPLDVSQNYKWFSLGNLSKFFDVTLHPKPISDSLSLNTPYKLSPEYGLFLAKAVNLVERKELDSDTLKQIDVLEVEIANFGKKITETQIQLNEKWLAYCSATLTDKGDIVTYQHWEDGQYEAQKLFDLREEQNTKYALQSALRQKQYIDPDHKAIADGFAAFRSPASRLRYPRFPDTEYGEEAKKFSVVYFASKPDNDSSLFSNLQLITPMMSVDAISTGGFGGTTSTVEKNSEAGSKIVTDWGASGGGGWGPFRMKASVSSHEEIKEDFKFTQKITVGAKSLMAIPFDARPWFQPTLFQNKIVQENEAAFEKFLGEKGSLRYFPSHLIVARGMNFTFHSSQDWKYDYKKDFSASGSASLSAFGIGFSGGARYSKHEERQLVEQRGHDLVLDDGEQNIRILGYIAVKNPTPGELRAEQMVERFRMHFT